MDPPRRNSGIWRKSIQHLRDSLKPEAVISYVRIRRAETKTESSEKMPKQNGYLEIERKQKAYESLY
jgi:hypothetical protein